MALALLRTFGQLRMSWPVLTADYFEAGLLKRRFRETFTYVRYVLSHRIESAARH